MPLTGPAAENDATDCADLTASVRGSTYPATGAMLARATAALGANRDLARLAAYGRLENGTRVSPAVDRRPVGPRARCLSTTQLNLTPMPGDVIAEVFAYHRRVEHAAARRVAA